MSVNTKSISYAVREIIINDASFQDSLQYAYCNISALARVIRPLIDQILAQNINVESIVTALTRSRKVYNFQEHSIASILANSSISVKTDVAKVSANKSKKTIEKVAKALTQNVDNFVSMSESILSITLLFDDISIYDVNRKFKPYESLKIEEELA